MIKGIRVDDWLMQYFLPFWPADDIYEQFDPWSEKTQGKELRIWEVFENPPLDGVLVSLENLKRHKKINELAMQEGIHKMLRYDGVVMGDCGAFSYIDKNETPDPIDTLEKYRKMGFDIGFTVDHLIVKSAKGHVFADEEKQERYEITLENAETMFDKSLDSKYENFRLIGVTQGMDVKSYKTGVQKLLNIGFDYIALGGLVRKTTKMIIHILENIQPTITAELRIRKRNNKIPGRISLHLFGIGRLNMIHEMMKYNVTSFDSATYLRKAWLDASKNYLLNDDFYSAVRIPIAKKDGNKKLEEAVFDSVLNFTKNEITPDIVLTKLLKYDVDRTSVRKEKYLHTLSEKPWEQCDCPLCHDLGVHMLILRGNERNMRRGFHNVYQFHKLLRSISPRILAMTWCTNSKRTDTGLLPAYLRYSKSPTFRNFWLNVYDLPVDINILSAKYGLIDWKTKIPYYEEKLVPEKIFVVVEELKSKLRYYDKVFFIGLGTYKQSVEQVVEETELPIEIYPRVDYSNGRRLDIIEFNKQMKRYREDIISEISHVLDIKTQYQTKKLTEYTE